MEPVAIELPKPLKGSKGSEKKKILKSHFEISVDKIISSCIIREVSQEANKMNVWREIPLEDIKEVRKVDKPEAGCTELILFYGMEFNLKSFEFRIKDPNKNTVDSVQDNLSILIKKACDLPYWPQRIGIWLWREYHSSTYATEGLNLKRLKTFTNRVFANKISTAELEKIVEKFSKGTGVILFPDFELFARQLLHLSKIFEEVHGTRYAQFEAMTKKSNNYIQKKLEKRMSKSADGIDLPTVKDLGIGRGGVVLRSKVMKKISSDALELKRFSDVQLSPLPEQNPPSRKESVTSEDRKSLPFFSSLDILQSSVVDNPLTFETDVHSLFSNLNTVWNPAKFGLSSDNDMNHPLTHYWIASSHNTYLTGNQYSSTSSVECYARSLRQGCRCIEIDVWDGPSKKPIVTHGRTLTSSLNLEDVLRTIKKHAFVTSTYPVIISIENHCSAKQQTAMAKLLLLVFDKMLFYFSSGNKTLEQQEVLPSLSDLQNRILLKCRKLPELKENEQRHAGGSSEQFLCGTLMTGKLFRLLESPNKRGEMWEQYFFALTNERLMYIEIPDDNDRRNSLKRRELEVLDDTELHLNELWFYGKLDGGRDKAADMVTKFGVDGGFLVRNSDAIPNEYCLCVLGRDKEKEFKVYHMRIRSSKSSIPVKGMCYHLVPDPKESEMCPSLHALISYYQEHPIILTNGHQGKLTEAARCEEMETSHESEPWFYPNLDRTSAERVLAGILVDGAFVARYSSDRQEGRFIISFRIGNHIKHCRIKEKGRFLTVSAEKFSSLRELVEFYRDKEIDKHYFYKDTFLRPVDRIMYELSLAQDLEQLNSVYATVGYLSSHIKTEKTSVVATHPYSSDNPDYLSLEVGDKIINVVKSDDGWWRGDIPGQGEKKLFCANFVEEIECLHSPFGDLEKGSVDIGIATYQKNKEKGNSSIPYKVIIGDKKDKKNSNLTYLGVSSLREAKDWVEHINYVFAKKKNCLTLKAVKQHKISKEFSDLIVLSCSNAAAAGTSSQQEHNISRMKSFSEFTGTRTFTSDQRSFIIHHQKVLSRVYPKPTRMDSSNLNPIRFWNVGCQIVALNYQTPSKPMQWNRGKFRQNGGCGYVLKPKFMIDNDVPSDWEYSNKKTLTLKIIAGRHFTKLEKGTICPYVEIEVVGVDADCKKFKTKTIVDNGLNPYWCEEFVIPIHNPELALIQFSVIDEDTFGDGQVLAESTIPMTCMRSGCRSVQLYNKHGEELYSMLLIQSSIK